MSCAWRVTGLTFIRYTKHQKIVKPRSANRYRQPTTDKDIYKFSFFPRTTTDWNRLPETTISLQVISQYHRELPYAAEFQPSCILHTLGPWFFVYSFNCSYAEGFLVVFDMCQCKITLKMSPALYQEEGRSSEDWSQWRTAFDFLWFVTLTAVNIKIASSKYRNRNKV